MILRLPRIFRILSKYLMKETTKQSSGRLSFWKENWKSLSCSMVKLQGLFDRLMVIINKIRALGCEKWDDHKVTRRFLRAYQVKNMGLAQMIRVRDDYDEMKPHTLLGKLQQHEMADQAAIKAVERVPNAMVPNVGGSSK